MYWLFLFPFQNIPLKNSDRRQVQKHRLELSDLLEKSLRLLNLKVKEKGNFDNFCFCSENL